MDLETIVDWIRDNPVFSSITGGGLLVTILLGSWFFSSVNGVSQLKSETRNLRGQIQELANNTPDETQLSTLEYRLNHFQETNNQLRSHLSFDIPQPDERPEGDSRFFLRTRISELAGEIENRFRSSPLQVPEQFEGFPSEISGDQFDRNWRDIQVANHLYQLILDLEPRNFSYLRPVETGGNIPRFPADAREFRPAGTPLTFQLEADPDTILQLLYQLQQPGQYLFFQSLRAESLEVEEGTVPLRLTATVVSLQTREDTSGEQQGEEENGTSESQEDENNLWD